MHNRKIKQQNPLWKQGVYFCAKSNQKGIQNKGTGQLYSNKKSNKKATQTSGLISFNFDEISFENLSFMDSTGIGLLIGRYKKLKQLNIPSYITGASITTEKVIELAGLYSIMPKQ